MDNARWGARCGMSMTTTLSPTAFLSTPMMYGAHGLLPVLGSVPTQFWAMALPTLSSLLLVKAVPVWRPPEALIAWPSWNQMLQGTISVSMALDPQAMVHRIGRFRFQSATRICPLAQERWPFLTMAPRLQLLLAIR